ncbi:MAG: hypothetical protein ACFE89_07770 [Candidatus Hodarchaeota archaeon]
MLSLQQICENVLDEIRPTRSEIEESYRVFLKVKERLQQKADEKRLEIAFIELEGSSGPKQTQLRNKKELDVFIGLPLSVLALSRPESLSKSALRKFFRKLVKEIALEAVTEAGSQFPSIAYAEHPYVSASLDNYNLDIVFCFDLTPEYLLEKGPITAVDRTPHHSRFVDSHLSPNQRDHVRLLKAFLTSTFVYGDASPVGRSGFTGFSTEMLIYHKQSFKSALKFLTHPAPTPLDYFTRPAQELKQLFNEPLIIVDPTDPNRNIASSISIRAHRYTTDNAQTLLQRPHASFFSMQPIPVIKPVDLKSLGPNYFIIEFQDETGWHYTKTRDKLYRYSTKLGKFLSHEPTGELRFGTVIFEEVFDQQIFAIALYIEKTDISPIFVREGPRAKFAKGVEEFRKKHPDAFQKDGRYQVSLHRNFTNAEHALRYFLTENPLSDKLSLIEITHRGSTKVGQQALWILTRAVQPFESPLPT